MCIPAPWMKVRLASGLLVNAADLYDGAQLVGVNDMSYAPAVGIVRRPQRIWKDRVDVHLEDGRDVSFSLDHRLLVEDHGWLTVQDLRPGDVLLGDVASRVKAIVPAGKGEVVTFQVDGCHTYLAEGILCHNMKTP